MLTEAEQHRLVLENDGLVESIAARYRGRKGIPFEELVSEGFLGLCVAAKNWEQRAKFSTYATDVIDGYILNFINRWEVWDQVDEWSDEDEDRVHEWLIWGVLPSDGWTELPATPQQIRDLYNAIKLRDPAAIQAAALSMTRLERKMVSAMFDRDLPGRPEQIARDCKRSYFETISTLWDAVRKIAETSKRIAENKRSEFARPATVIKQVVPSR